MRASAPRRRSQPAPRAASSDFAEREDRTRRLSGLYGYRPPAAGKGEFKGERRVVAFVLQQGRPIGASSWGPSRPFKKQRMTGAPS